MDEPSKLEKTAEDVKAAYGVAEKGVQSAWAWSHAHTVAATAILSIICGFILGKLF